MEKQRPDTVLAWKKRDFFTDIESDIYSTTITLASIVKRSDISEESDIDLA